MHYHQAPSEKKGLFPRERVNIQLFPKLGVKAFWELAREESLVILTDDKVRRLYGDNLSSTTTATMVPPGSGCGCSGTNILAWVSSVTQTPLSLCMHVDVWQLKKREREIMYFGPQKPPGSRGSCYDPTS